MAALFPALTSVVKRFVPYAGEALLAHDVYKEVAPILFPVSNGRAHKRRHAAPIEAKAKRARHNPIMPRYSRARRGRRSSVRNRRASMLKKKYRKRSSRFRSHRRRVRRARRPRIGRSLRLYPGGVPLTHKIKLRVMKQVQVSSFPGGWGYIVFSPASLSDPFQHFTTGGVVGAHQALPYGLIGGATTPKPQPYGFDHWVGITDSNRYRKYKVLGAKITLAKINEAVEPGVTQPTQWAGFSKLFAVNDDFGTTFNETYSNVDRTEVEDWVNCGIVKRPQTITKAKAFNQAPAVFTHTYSAKKYQRTLKKVGVTDGDWYGEHGTDPVINPRVYFSMADPGASTTAITFLFWCTIDYTVQLTGLRLGGEDVA